MITFHFEDTKFEFKRKVLTRKWLKLVAESEIRRVGDIAVIFVTVLVAGHLSTWYPVRYLSKRLL